MTLLIFYVNEKQRHDGKPLYEWLLERARTFGVQGGSAFRSIAGFGRNGKLHEDTFFELAGELTVKVEFVADDELVERFLAALHTQQLDIFYLRSSVHSGLI